MCMKQLPTQMSEDRQTTEMSKATSESGHMRTWWRLWPTGKTSLAQVRLALSSHSSHSGHVSRHSDFPRNNYTTPPPSPDL